MPPHLPPSDDHERDDSQDSHELDERPLVIQSVAARKRLTIIPASNRALQGPSSATTEGPSDPGNSENQPADRKDSVPSFHLVPCEQCPEIPPSKSTEKRKRTSPHTASEADTGTEQIAFSSHVSGEPRPYQTHRPHWANSADFK